VWMLIKFSELTSVQEIVLPPKTQGGLLWEIRTSKSQQGRNFKHATELATTM
jgi:hypothetical protein